MLNCLAGVDEAGLGPILGPLVVAGTALTGPEGINPWLDLQSLVSRKAPKAGQIQVADSKKVKQGKYGQMRLEQTVLCFWGAWQGSVPATLREFLTSIGSDLQALERCPWYADLDIPLPLHSAREEVELRAQTLREELLQHRIEILHMGIRPVDVEEFNTDIAATDNKSTTHFHAYSSVIKDLVHRLPDGAHLIADRCGGRMHYAGGLIRSGIGARIRTLHERNDTSAYDLSYDDRTVKLTFATQGEERAFPTALASCAAKYTRELMMHLINRWFGERIADLKPTAGYYVDGHRFLGEIADFARTADLPLGRLVRVR